MGRKIKGVIFRDGWRVRCYLGGREINIRCDSAKTKPRRGTGPIEGRAP